MFPLFLLLFELKVVNPITQDVVSPMQTKSFLIVNGCNLLLIDFLLPLSRGTVCEVQSPAML